MSSTTNPDEGKGRTPAGDRTTPPTGRPAEETVVPVTEDRRAVVAREKEAFGGIKVGAAFFGWLTATGTAVILTALVAGTGAALGLTTQDLPKSTDTANVQTVGLTGGIILLVVIFIAYYCGGYVAGRMSRFNGLRQGVAVWLWAIVIAIVVAILGVLAGQNYDVLARLNGFPRIPVNEGTLTTAGIVTAVGVVVVSLIGAILGGLGGMRFHRKVDRAGLGR
ncbi:hypothetical protein GCM10009841_34410 [Microlunatus panaciterrae]|uniref:Major facilitator superfamily (MFS) profile domain-containing protein n=1 Tax=Microlunatus panaciterrae TaxID=400768 RepID=A0ABS2RGH1_9ACTN|nr:hypothetical protein [Microlunatus panaciterrae]MBM7798099.1 hypothetical protein [Microlunatus panaciterrae]